MSYIVYEGRSEVSDGRLSKELRTYDLLDEEDNEMMRPMNIIK